MQNKFKIQKRKHKASISTSARRRFPTWVRNLLSGGRLHRVSQNEAKSIKPPPKQVSGPEDGQWTVVTVDSDFEKSEKLCMASIEAALPETPSKMVADLPLAASAHHLPPYMVNMLHHSANNSNYHPSLDRPPLEVELRYPSGYSERFLLAHNPPHSRSSPKCDRRLEPIDDLLTTISVILHLMTGPIGPHTKLCPLLRTAYESHNMPLFIETMKTITHHLSSPLKIMRPSRPLIHHFFAQLYDRSVAPYSKGLDSRRDPKTTNSVYGELQPSFLSRIFKQTNLGPQSVYVDLGSGVGNTAMQAALETGAEAHGIERENYAHLVSALHLQQFHIRCMLWGLRPGKVQLYQTDFLRSTTAAHLLPEADVVVVNNFKFEPDTDLGLFRLLERGLKIGAKVVSMRPVVTGKLRSPRCDGEEGEVFRVEECVYDEDSVSWSGSKGVYYVSTKMR